MSIKMQIFLTWFELIAFSLVYIVFIGSAITFILSYFSRRIKRRTICIVFLVSLVIMVPFAAVMPCSFRPPGAVMGSKYKSAVTCIAFANYPDALELLGESKEWAKSVPDKSEAEILKKKPQYLGSIDYLIACLDGGSLSVSDLQDCIVSDDISAIGYLWTNTGQHIILNIYPPGIAYLAIETGDSAQISDILNEQSERSDYSIDIKRENSDTDKRAICWKYQSDDCISNIAKAVTLDQFFAHNESHRSQPGKASQKMFPFTATDYFTIGCQGNQINGYCNMGEGNPPWSNFRQAVLDIVKATLNTGTEITPEEYIQELQEAEGNSGVRVLTGSDFQKMIVAAYQY